MENQDIKNEIVEKAAEVVSNNVNETLEAKLTMQKYRK